MHACEDEMVCSSTSTDKVPYFNAPIYLQNKSVIGKVDEILGPINQVFFSIKMEAGIVANSFQKGDKVYIGEDKLLPIERFLPKPKLAGGASVFLCSTCTLLTGYCRCNKYASTLRLFCLTDFIYFQNADADEEDQREDADSGAVPPEAHRVGAHEALDVAHPAAEAALAGGAAERAGSRPGVAEAASAGAPHVAVVDSAVEAVAVIEAHDVVLATCINSPPKKLCYSNIRSHLF